MDDRTPAIPPERGIDFADPVSALLDAIVGGMFGMSMDLHAALTRTDDRDAAEKVRRVITDLDTTIANLRTVMLRTRDLDRPSLRLDPLDGTADRESILAPTGTVARHPHVSAVGEDVRIAHLISLEGQLVGGCRYVTVIGEIDLATTPLLRSYLRQQLADLTSVLVIDLRGVTFVDAGGIAALVETHRAAQRKGIHLQLIADSRAVLRPLEATELIDLFDIHTDLTEAAKPPPEMPTQAGPLYAVQA